VELPRFGDRLVGDVSQARLSSLRVAPRTKNKLLTIVGGVFRRAQKRFGLQRHPVLEIERLREPGQIDLEVFSPEEIMALVRAAKTEPDAAIYLTFPDIRGEAAVGVRFHPDMAISAGEPLRAGKNQYQNAGRMRAECGQSGR